MREKKKGKAGPSAQYLTRTQAIRKLQITLKDFRRLCILKGIYPREPKKKLKGSDKTYYHKKDVKFLAHEPLLQKFRQFKTFLKKYTKAKAKRNMTRLKTLRENRPMFTLDHLVKERYPSFVDALRDLDDPLTMIHLFAMMRTKIIGHHRTEHSDMCRRLVKEFQHYNVCAHVLRKVFVSIKGIYYQSRIQGQDITWVVPHKFAQQIPTDVDFRILITFLDFYLTMLKFVNCTLYHKLGLAYPPQFDAAKEDSGAVLQSLKAAPSSAASSNPVQDSALDSVVQEIKQKQDDMDTDMANEDDEVQDTADIDDFTKLSGKDSVSHATATQLSQASEEEQESQRVGKLFAGLTVFLSRETPQDSLEFVLLCAGATVLRDDSLTAKQIKELEFTHMVMDRPQPKVQISGRTYVQPQWVYDSFNARALLPVAPYGPGVVPPPHLSPFVDDLAEGYIPKQRKVLEQWGAQTGKASSSSATGVTQPDSKDNSDDDEEMEEQRYHSELQKETAGVSFSAKAKDDQDSSDDEKKDEDDDDEDMTSDSDSDDDAAAKPSAKEKTEKELAQIMMDKKSKRLYQRMQTGIARKQAQIDELKRKRKLHKQQKRRGQDAAPSSMVDDDEKDLEPAAGVTDSKAATASAAAGNEKKDNKKKKKKKKRKRDAGGDNTATVPAPTAAAATVSAKRKKKTKKKHKKGAE